jgi:hypothetical protein
MSAETLERFFGKRFTGLLASLATLASAYFVGPVEKFSALATTVGLIFGAYVGGQSFTDAKEAQGK